MKHEPRYGRANRGRSVIAGPSGSYYGTTVRCSCGWRKQVNLAPSRGGHREAEILYAEHVKEVGQ